MESMLQTLRSCQPKSVVSAGDSTRDLYQELPPFSVDTETGEVLNPSSSFKLVKVGTEDVQEKIQSFYDSSSLAKQLEHIQEGSLDSSALKAVNGSYLDVSQVPSDIDDLIKYLNDIRNNALQREAEKKALAEKAQKETYEKALADKQVQDDQMKALVAQAVAEALAKKEAK